MNSNNADPQALLASRAWRLRHSLWLLAPILGFGLLSFVGFLYVAIRVRSRKFWLIAAAASAGGVLVWVFSGDPDSSKDAASDNVFGAILFAVWAGSIALGFIINRDYLRWRATSRAWWAQQTPAPTTAGAPTGAAPAPYAPSTHSGQPYPRPQSQPDVLGVNTDQYFAAPSPQTPAPPSTSTSWPVSAPPAPRPTAVPPRAALPALIDVNAASAAELTDGSRVSSPTADRIVAAREAQGPYRDLDDLVARARLGPHEMIRLRGDVVFGQAPGATPSGPPASPTGGRVLDI